MVRRPFTKDDDSNQGSSSSSPLEKRRETRQVDTREESLPAYVSPASTSAFATFHDSVSPKNYGIPINPSLSDNYVVALYDYKRYVESGGIDSVVIHLGTCVLSRMRGYALLTGTGIGGRVRLELVVGGAFFLVIMCNRAAVTLKLLSSDESLDKAVVIRCQARQAIQALGSLNEINHRIIPSPSPHCLFTTSHLPLYKSPPTTRSPRDNLARSRNNLTLFLLLLDLLLVGTRRATSLSRHRASIK